MHFFKSVFTPLKQLYPQLMPARSKTKLERGYAFFLSFCFFLSTNLKITEPSESDLYWFPSFWKFDAFSLFFFSYNVERRYIDFFNFSLELKNTWTFHSKLCPVVHRNFVSWLLLIYLYIFINHLPIQKTLISFQFDYVIQPSIVHTYSHTLNLSLTQARVYTQPLK